MSHLLHLLGQPLDLLVGEGRLAVGLFQSRLGIVRLVELLFRLQRLCVVLVVRLHRLQPPHHVINTITTTNVLEKGQPHLYGYSRYY